MQCTQALLDNQDIDLASPYSQKRRPTKLWTNNQHSLFAFEEMSPHLGLVILSTYFANCRTLMAFYGKSYKPRLPSHVCCEKICTLRVRIRYPTLNNFRRHNSQPSTRFPNPTNAPFSSYTSLLPHVPQLEASPSTFHVPHNHR